MVTVPMKDMLDYGVRISAGSDAPCTIPDPVMSIHAACNHPNADQRISVPDALKMHTNRSACFTFDESNRGTLTAGKMTDFVVLDQDPLEITPEKIKDIKVTSSYLNGKKYEPILKSPFALALKSLLLY